MSFNNKKIIALASACLFLSAHVLAQEVIWESGRNVFIKYAKRDSSAFGENDHPVILDEAEVDKALGSLTFQPKDRDAGYQDLQPVFTEEQVHRLSESLAVGLARARPNQDIVFVLEKKVKRLLGSEPRRLYTAGRAFYQYDKLNVIIGNHDRAVDEAFAAAYDPTRVGIVAYDFDHGRRTSRSISFKRAVMTNDGVDNRHVDGAARNDWLVIDIESAAEASDLRQQQKVAEEQDRKRAEMREMLTGEAEKRTDHVNVEVTAEKRTFAERLTRQRQRCSMAF